MLVINNGTQKNRWITVLNILTVLTIALCLILVGLTITWRVNTLRAHVLRQTQPKHCCNCQDLKTKQETDEVLKDFQRLGPNQTECCGYVGAILDRLLDKVLQERHTSEVSLRHVPNESCDDDTPETPAANLVDIHKEPVTLKANIDSYPIMMRNATPSFVRGGLIYKDGKIEITTSGYYHIYSQLQLQINSTNAKSLLFKHYVMQDSVKIGKQKMILENTERPCETREPTLQITSSVGAVFQLDKNDKVYVTASDPQHLQHGHSNVFSVQMISKTEA